MPTITAPISLFDDDYPAIKRFSPLSLSEKNELAPPKIF